MKKRMMKNMKMMASSSRSESPPLLLSMEMHSIGNSLARVAKNASLG
jgi:hypothetical protein